MSSTITAAKTAASDKVDVSFATDDEETSSSAEESEDESTSSSESGDNEKSDGDGDADDESEMPTFTLSLQPSTGANDADDALPDLSRSTVSTLKQETQQEIVVEKTGSLSETETKLESVTSQTASSSTKADEVVADVAKETPPVVLVPAEEEVEEESSEESEQSEESEDEADSKEEEESQKVQNLLSSSMATTSSTTVSTNIDTKQDTAVSSSKLSVTESKEVKEEHVETTVTETETILNVKQVMEDNSSVTKVDAKRDNLSTEAKEKSPIKETVVAEPEINFKIETTEKMSNLSTSVAAETAKAKITKDVEIVSSSSIPNPEPQPCKKHKKDSTTKEAKTEKREAETADSTLPSARVVEASDVKHESDVQEKIKLTDEKSTVKTKLPKTTEVEGVSESKTKEQSETVDSTKSSKSRKTKVDGKKIKEEVTKTAEEEMPTQSVVEAEQNANSLKPKKVKSKTVTDAETKPTVDHEKTAEAHKHEKSVSGTTKVDTADKVKSEESIRNVGKSIVQTTKTNAVEVAVNESPAAGIETAKITDTEASDEKLLSKKKSKHSTVVRNEGSVVETVVANSSVDDLGRDERKSHKTFEANVAEKSGDLSTTVTATKTETSKSPNAGVELEREKNANATEAGLDKNKSVPAENFSGKVTVDDVKLNEVDDEVKLLTGDDTEFRPRRNSIDEFIKRILAEAREEQKKILDSCAVASTEEATSETKTPDIGKVTDGLPSSKETEQPQQSMVNGIDVGVRVRSARSNREDFDIDDELADISRYYAKRTVAERVFSNDEESAELRSTTQVDDLVKPKSVVNADDSLPPTSAEEVLHFVPQRRESTAALVRDSSRPVRVLLDQQTSVIRQLTEASRAVDELDNEIRQLRQATGGREALYSSIGAAIRDELRIYEMELTAAGERIGQQRLPGGGRFVREQFVAQCAAELLHRSATTNGPRLDRAVSVDDWTRVGRRRSGSFSAAVDEDMGGISRNAARPWISTNVDRDTSDLMIQYRHSRSGSVISDRGYSSVDTADESRATTSSLLSRLTSINGSTTATELDFSRSSRASSETPRPSFRRSQTTSDDWPSATNSTYSLGRHYIGYSFDTADDTNGEPDVTYRVSATRPPVQPTYRRYQPSSIDTTTAPHSRLYVRRGSLQGYSSYDSAADTDAGRSFNSRFLSRVREKKALGETTSRQTTGDRPFRSRFLKSSSVTGSASNTYSSSRYESDER